MKDGKLYALWGVLYIFCGLLGFIREPNGFVTALLVLLIWAQRKLRLVLKTRWLSSGSPNQRALRLWAEALHLSRLRKQDPPEALEQLAQKAKFSQYTLEAAELAQFDAYLTQSRAQLRRRPWYWQLLYRWLWVIY